MHSDQNWVVKTAHVFHEFVLEPSEVEPIINVGVRVEGRKCHQAFLARFFAYSNRHRGARLFRNFDLPTRGRGVEIWGFDVVGS